MTSRKRHHLHQVGEGSSKVIVIATQQHVISSKPVIVSSNVEIEQHISVDFSTLFACVSAFSEPYHYYFFAI